MRNVTILVLLNFNSLKRTVILKMLLILLATYIAIVLGLYLALPHMSFHPERLDADTAFSFDAPYEEINLTTADGETINAIWFKTEQASKGLVLYFHGNKGTLQRWGQYHPDFINRGYDCLFIDYRGYGKSSGSPSEQGLYRDAEAAWAWAIQQYAPENIVLFGRSLGTGVASYLAVQTQPKQLILETPYNSIKGVAYAFAPILWLPVDPKPNFSNQRNLPQVQCPVFIVHGTEDEVVPYRAAVRLKPLLKRGDQFLTIEGGAHKNLGSFEEYRSWLDEIL